MSKHTEIIYKNGKPHVHYKTFGKEYLVPVDLFPADLGSPSHVDGVLAVSREEDLYGLSCFDRKGLTAAYFRTSILSRHELPSSRIEVTPCKKFLTEVSEIDELSDKLYKELESLKGRRKSAIKEEVSRLGLRGDIKFENGLMVYKEYCEVLKDYE